MIYSLESRGAGFGYIKKALFLNSDCKVLKVVNCLCTTEPMVDMAIVVVEHAG